MQVAKTREGAEMCSRELALYLPVVTGHFPQPDEFKRKFTF